MGWAAASSGARRRSIPRSAPMPARRTGMIPAVESASPGLYRLLAWLSPSFPTGGFSYSHGLEAAVASGAVHNRATLEAWVGSVIAYGTGRMDADILCDA